MNDDDKKLLAEAEWLIQDRPFGPPESAMTAHRFIAESKVLIPRLVARLRELAK